MNGIRNHQAEIMHYIMTFVGGFMGLYAICAHGSYGSAQTGNLMQMLIDFSDGEMTAVAARVGAFLLFCGGIVVSWLLTEFCHLPMRELCIVVDAAALLFSAWIKEDVYPFFHVYPLFFATSFQWGTFSGVGKYASPSLFLTGNLKNCITRGLKYIFYRNEEDGTGFRIYTATIINYLAGGCLGCWAVDRMGAMGACYGFIPLSAAAALLAAERWTSREEASYAIIENGSQNK